MFSRYRLWQVVNKNLSIINECCRYNDYNSGYEFDTYSYKSHSYYVESGKKIELSDIVADEDAFFPIS